MTPDYAKAKAAAGKVFALIDYIPPIDNQSEDGKKPVCGRRINLYVLVL
jgi:hypothetical protein